MRRRRRSLFIANQEEAGVAGGKNLEEEKAFGVHARCYGAGGGGGGGGGGRFIQS